jgi:hypothetical protein
MDAPTPPAGSAGLVRRNSGLQQFYDSSRKIGTQLGSEVKQLMMSKKSTTAEGGFDLVGVQLVVS